MKPLPPELQPKLYPATRAGTIERCRALLDELASRGDDRGFCLLIAEPDMSTTQQGSGSLADFHVLAIGALHQLGEGAKMVGEPKMQHRAGLGMQILGARTYGAWGGVRPQADDGDATPHDDNGGAP